MYRTTEATQRRKDEKRQVILDAAARVFSSKGYHGTTVRDIVDEAGVSVGSFYFYFDGKAKLFAELYRYIEKEFRAVTLSVLDIENFTILKNFTRVMTATLWMYERKRAIARIALLEAATTAPTLQRLEADRMNESAEVMSGWFRKFRQNHSVSIPDERVAALVYASSYNCLVSDWLASDGGVPLTNSCFAFCVYNLQALGIDFEEASVREYIGEVIGELSAHGSDNPPE